MKENKLKKISAEFADENLIFFEGKGKLICARMQNKYGEATVNLHGAHLISYIPSNQKYDIFFMSDSAKFAENKAIRGGIPVCWPWFGVNTRNSDLPSHGFARVADWEIESVITSDDTLIDIVFAFKPNEKMLKMFDNSKIESKLRVKLSDKLSLSLSTINKSGKNLLFSEALHSYFKVGDINKVSVAGLGNKEYFDALKKNKKIQKGDIVIDREIDRVYDDNGPFTQIIDKNLRRKITVVKKNSLSTVVWNPWIDKSERMPDFRNDEYKQMLCVETANALENSFHLPGNEGVHTMFLDISAENI